MHFLCNAGQKIPKEWVTTSHLMKRLLFSLVAFLAASSPAFAQFNWVNWSYPTNKAATANVGAGTVNLSVTGADINQVGVSDYGIQYQASFPYTQTTGHSAGALNGGTSKFSMELDFNSFMSTAGLVLAIGNVRKQPGFAGYAISAFDASNNPIALTSFGQFGDYDYKWLPPHPNIHFTDDLSLNTSNGKLIVTPVTGGNGNSDMLILSLPAGVSKIVVNLQNPANALADTIDFMVAPPAVPEPASLGLGFVGGVVAFVAFRWKIRRRAS
ncbi:MAG TPA: hypothetical protein VGG02_07670 [Chthoniobacterales bacterium]